MRAKRAGKMWNWTVVSKHVIMECKRSEPENVSNWTVASEASGKFLENFALFIQNSSKLHVRSYYLFSFQKRTNYLFPAFSRSEYLFPKSARPPPPQNQMVVPLIPSLANITSLEKVGLWQNPWKSVNRSTKLILKLIASTEMSLVDHQISQKLLETSTDDRLTVARLTPFYILYGNVTVAYASIVDIPNS